MPTQKLCSAVTRHADKLGRCKDGDLFGNIQERSKNYFFKSIFSTFDIRQSRCCKGINQAGEGVPFFIFT